MHRGASCWAHIGAAGAGPLARAGPLAHARAPLSPRTDANALFSDRRRGGICVHQRHWASSGNACAAGPVQTFCRVGCRARGAGRRCGRHRAPRMDSSWTVRKLWAARTLCTAASPGQTVNASARAHIPAYILTRSLRICLPGGLATPCAHCRAPPSRCYNLAQRRSRLPRLRCSQPAARGARHSRDGASTVAEHAACGAVQLVCSPSQKNASSRAGPTRRRDVVHRRAQERVFAGRRSRGSRHRNTRSCGC